MGTPTVIPETSKQGWAMWPAQDTSEDVFAVLDKFSEAGFAFIGEITVYGAQYWLFKQPVTV